MTPPAAPPLPQAAARDADRAQVLRALGAGPAETGELLAYNRSAFVVPPDVSLPLADEPFVQAWQGYADRAADGGLLAVLRAELVQLRFPVAAGTSADDAYQAAIRRGIVPPDTGDLLLEDEDGLRLFIHPTPAGAVPVLLAPRRADFEALVRALTRKNEPVALPPSMGACMVGGYNNWGRVADLRRRWQAGEVRAGDATEWSAAFAVLKADRALYQDRFVLLSGGAYSGVPADAMELEADAWNQASITIRLEHECAHYFTRRVLGSMRNNLLDELLADYVGIVAAAGRYRADWALRFLGLEAEDGCRADGRVWNYRGEPPLSDAAFAVLQRLLREAVLRVQAMDAGLGPAARTPEGRARVLLALAELTLEEIAAGAAEERLPPPAAFE
jgi:hypothetical protein